MKKEEGEDVNIEKKVKNSIDQEKKQKRKEKERKWLWARPTGAKGKSKETTKIMNT